MSSQWHDVTTMMTSQPVAFGTLMAQVGHEYWGAVRRLACYKFAAKMFGKNRRILDLSCGDGFGTWLLAKECGFAHGIAPTEEAWQPAAANWNQEQVVFSDDSYLDSSAADWDGLVLVFSEQKETSGSRLREQFIHSCRLLRHDGIAIIALEQATDAPGTAHFLQVLATNHFQHQFVFGLPNLTLIDKVRGGIVVCCRPREHTS